MGYKAKIVFDLNENDSNAENKLQEMIKEIHDRSVKLFKRAPQVKIELEEEKY